VTRLRGRRAAGEGREEKGSSLAQQEYRGYTVLNTEGGETVKHEEVSGKKEKEGSLDLEEKFPSL